MYYVYILETLEKAHWYVGMTNDLRRRMEEHNEGRSTHTNKFRPWSLKTYIAFSDKKKAEGFENYLKSHSGRAFSKKYL